MCDWKCIKQFMQRKRSKEKQRMRCPKETSLSREFILCIHLLTGHFSIDWFFPRCLTWWLQLSDQVAESNSCLEIKLEDGEVDEEPSARGTELSPSPAHSDVSISRWVQDKLPILIDLGSPLNPVVKVWFILWYKKLRSLFLTTTIHFG